MSLHHCEDIQGDFEATDTNEEYDSINGIEMGSKEIDKIEAEFQLANDTIEASPRTTHSGASSSDIFASPITNKELTLRPRPKSARLMSIPKICVPRPTAPLSSIPLPVKSSGPIKIPAALLKNASKSVNRTGSIGPRTTTLANKHTLEIQFINKNKRYVQLRRELEEKQRPIMDLYQNLTQIKRRLEDLGKTVKLEEIKLIPFEEFEKKRPSSSMQGGGGEQVSMEVVNSMKGSIEEIPKTLMDICKNLLSRRALIVELLESVTKSEVDMTQVSDKIESLKCEGQQLQQSLDAVIREHEQKINQLVSNWQKLLNDKQCFNTDSRIEELEGKLKEEERLREESSTIIHDLHRKMEDRRASYDKSVAELNGVLQTLKDQIKKLEQDLDNERKTSVDFRSRNTSNAQNLKCMRTRITELESDKKDVEGSNAELQKKIRLLQEQLKYKETQWMKEKEEMSKSLKHQENLLQKITADKNQFETRLDAIEGAKNANEVQLQSNIASLREQLHTTRTQLCQVVGERNEALEKCAGFESYVARMGAECRETMNKVSYSIEWGKALREVSTAEADNYMQSVAKDLRIRELEDKIHDLERERDIFGGKLEISKGETISSKVVMKVQDERESVRTYQLLLEESENKLKDKLDGLRSTEVETLRAELRQLRVRQESLEEQNERCSPDEIHRMLEESKAKLHILMNRSVESDNKLEEYATMLEKQKLQMTEMDNLLRYRENMANVLKASRNELSVEKDSLAQYSREVRAALAEVTSQSKLKDDLIKSLHDKVKARESEMCGLERDIEELEQKLQMTNEKRYKLQETVGLLEKELQKTQARLKEVSAGVNTKPWSFLDSVYQVVEDKPNKKVSHYCNSLMARHYDETNNNTNEISLDENISERQNVVIRSRKKFHTQKKSFRRNPVIDPSTSDYSNNNKQSYQNLSSTITDTNHSSIHTHCHHKANSRSLISLSLQTVDYIKTKLNFLTSVNMDQLAEAPEQAVQTQISSTQTTQQHFDRTPSRNLSKILELTAHRYEYLQNQAQESYDDLSSLVKLAVTQKGGVKKQ